MRKSSSWAVLLCCVLAIVGAAPWGQAQNRRQRALAVETITDDDVLKAMHKGIDFLLQSKRGKNWQTKDVYATSENCGETALVLYALLEVGEALRDGRLTHASPELKEAVDWLLETTPDGCYSVALHILAASRLPDRDEYRKVLEKDKELLLKCHNSSGGVTYEPPTGYKPKKSEKLGDASHLQYATLAAWALSDFGSKPIELPNSHWPMLDKFWRTGQAHDGGWDYNFDPDRDREKDTNSLAGLASLFICSEFIDAPTTLTPKPDKNIEDALKHAIANYKSNSPSMYYLYNLERVGLAAGLKYFNTVDWYRNGAEMLLRTQKASGAWGGHFIGGNDNMGTAYALLFLSRGRHPVLFNKLEYAGPWNARPRDDAFLTRKLAKRFETPINWQIVNLKVDPTDWLDAPVLLITGSQDPHFTDADIDKLRIYIQAGGIVFSTADGDRQEFTNAMRKVAGKVVNGKYELREIPKDHAIFSATLWGKVAAPPRLWGMSNGVRDLWFHSPVDMGASWQGRRYARTEHWDVPTNIAFYATGKQSLQSKLSSLAIAPSKEPMVRSIQVGRLNLGDNWDPEPGAWPRLAKLAQTTFHTDLKLHELPPTGPFDVKTTPLIHFVGSTRFPVNQAVADRLKQYVDSGGTLLIDAAGGSTAFHESALQLFALMFPGKPPERISMTEPIVAGNLPDGAPLDKVEYRKYFRIATGSTPRDTRLMGYKVDKRWGVVYSAEDITSGLLGTQTWGISGYMPLTAQTIARNIILYVNDPAAAKAPTASAGPADSPK